jgi:hypothetical protein
VDVGGNPVRLPGDFFYLDAFARHDRKGCDKRQLFVLAVLSEL